MGCTALIEYLHILHFSVNGFVDIVMECTHILRSGRQD